MDFRRSLCFSFCIFIFTSCLTFSTYAEDYYEVNVSNKVPVLNWYKYNSTHVAKVYCGTGVAGGGYDCNWTYTLLVRSDGCLYYTHSSAGGYLFPVWDMSDETGLSLSRDNLTACVSHYDTYKNNTDYSNDYCYRVTVSVMNNSGADRTYKVYQDGSVIYSDTVSSLDSDVIVFNEYASRHTDDIDLSLAVQLDGIYTYVDNDSLDATWTYCDADIDLTYTFYSDLEPDIFSPFDNDTESEYFPDVDNDSDYYGQYFPDDFESPTSNNMPNDPVYSYNDNTVHNTYSADDNSTSQVLNEADNYGSDGAVSEEDLYRAMRKALNDEGNMYQGDTSDIGIDNDGFGDIPEYDEILDDISELSNDTTGFVNSWYQKLTSLSPLELPGNIGFVDQVIIDLSDLELINEPFTMDFTEHAETITFLRAVLKYFMYIFFFIITIKIVFWGVK